MLKIILIGLVPFVNLLYVHYEVEISVFTSFGLHLILQIFS